VEDQQLQEQTAQEKRKKADELFQVVTGVLLMVFAAIGVGFLVATRLEEVLSRY
jgi:succinate dehydrogenase hydrophobic anchor subunit